MVGFIKTGEGEGKYELVLCHDGPEKLETKEQVLVLAMVSQLDQTCSKLGIDVTQIEVHLEFMATKHKQGFRLKPSQKR